MHPLLIYAIPPLLGAFIGYMTNYVAIRMLFRPLKPWRLLGWRLPMTPGVIPKKRHELAENIGRMVGQHLLTSTEVSRAIHGENFQRELQELIDDRLAGLLQQDLGPLPTLVPQRFRPYFDSGVKVLRWRFLRQVHAYLAGDEFAAFFSRVFAGGLDGLLARKAGSCLPAGGRERVEVLIESAVARFLAGPRLEEWLRTAISGQVEETLEQNRSLSDLLPQELVEPLLAKAEQEAPALLRKVAAQMQEPLMQDRIARAVSQALAGFLDRLGPLAAMVQGFLRPEVIDEKIREYLADKGEEVSQWLFDETVQQKVTGLLREKATQWLATPLPVLLAKVDRQTIDQVQEGFADLLLRIAREPDTARRLAGGLANGLESQADRSLAELLTDLLGPEELQQTKKWLQAEILGVLRAPATRSMLDGMITELLESKLLSRPVGALADLLPQEVQRSMGGYLLQQLNEIMVREVPGLVDSLNIRHIVARKVDSLDLLRLENLLMGIMQEQFKYINLFGALLGFLIGLLNLIFLVGA